MQKIVKTVKIAKIVRVVKKAKNKKKNKDNYKRSFQGNQSVKEANIVIVKVLQVEEHTTGISEFPTKKR